MVPQDDLAAIYDQSFRALDEQTRVLEGLRARAGTLVGAATVTTAFVGGLTLLIYVPSRRWIFGHHPRRLLSTDIDPGPPHRCRFFDRRSRTTTEGTSTRIVVN
jgi:hypothetical protein